MKHFNGLSAGEAERLALLLEELGEAQQAIGKILRHGYESKHPDHMGTDDPDNRDTLVRELGDVRAAMAILHLAGDVDMILIERRISEKLERVRPYLHHQRGVL